MLKFAQILLLAGSLGGCVGESVLEREDIAIPAPELEALESTPKLDSHCLVGDTDCRNDYVALKMFEIDQNFAQYKILLSRGGAYENLTGDLIEVGLSGAAAVIPVTQTTKILSAASTAVGLTNTAVNKDLLLSQTIQTLEQQMTTQRESVKKTILARLEQCNSKNYPAGLVLSDIQAYADAGTITSALNNQAKATANAKATTNATSGTATPTTTSASPDSASASPDSAANNKINVGPGVVTVTFKATTVTCPISKPIS